MKNLYSEVIFFDYFIYEDKGLLHRRNSNDFHPSSSYNLSRDVSFQAPFTASAEECFTDSSFPLHSQTKLWLSLQISFCIRKVTWPALSCSRTQSSCISFRMCGVKNLERNLSISISWLGTGLGSRTFDLAGKWWFGVQYDSKFSLFLNTFYWG